MPNTSTFGTGADAIRTLIRRLKEQTMFKKRYMNRRSQSRREVDNNGFVQWRRKGTAAALRLAVLMNKSLMGVAFAASESTHPHIGQSLELFRRDGRRLGDYKVMRAHHTGDGTVAIGCRLMEDACVQKVRENCRKAA